MTGKLAGPPITRRSVLFALTALSLGGFGIGLTEFIVAGLLTEVSQDLEVTVSQAGHLVSAYALAVVPGALIITPILMKRTPKYALTALLGFFILGNALSAWSPTYDVMMIGRILAALTHGGYFGIGAVLAGSLVPEERRSSAIAALFAGLTIANVLGVPLGALVGQQFGWRTVFWLIVAVGVIALSALTAFVPATTPTPSPLTVKAQFHALTNPKVLASLATTALVFGGMFGVFTYIEPMLREVTGFSAGAIPWLLVLFGVGLFTGNVIGGRTADRSPDAAVFYSAALLPPVIIMLGMVSAYPVPTAVMLFILGAVGFATVPGLQARVMRHANGAEVLASSANIASFNLGNAIGVAVAGTAISAGYGLISPTITGSALTFVGVLLVAASRVRGRTHGVTHSAVNS